MGNPYHARDGKFTSGAGQSAEHAAHGDHLAAQPADKSLRRVNGQLMERSDVIAAHADTESVGTGPRPPRLSEAARANVIRGRAIDQRKYGLPATDPIVADKQRLIGTRTAPGKLSPSVNDMARAIMGKKRS